MNDFPVNQAKDGFVWDDGLEEAFIEKLKMNIQEYIRIAEISKKDRVSETQYSESASQDVQAEVLKTLVNIDIVDSIEGSEDNSASFQNKYQETIATTAPLDELREYVETVIQSQTEIVEKKVGTDREYCVSVNSLKKQTICISWSIGKKDFWLDYDDYDGKICARINVDHTFFKPYSNDEGFKVVLDKFVIAFIMAEVSAKSSSDKDGYIKASSLRHHMNKYLSQLGD